MAELFFTTISAVAMGSGFALALHVAVSEYRARRVRNALLAVLAMVLLWLFAPPISFVFFHYPLRAIASFLITGVVLIVANARTARKSQ